LASKEWAEDLDQIDDYLERTGQQPIPIHDLLKGLETIEKAKIPDNELLGPSDQSPETPRQIGIKAPTPTHDELNQLLEEEVDDEYGRYTVKGRDMSESKPHIEEADTKDEGEYADSYASQQETAQLREDFEGISKKFSSLETKFDLVMKERQNLPSVLNDMRADMNLQLTRFSDKLYQVLESQASKKEVSTVLASIDEVRIENDEQFRTAASYLSSDPKESSPLTIRGATLKGKGKFKAIK